MNLPLLKTLIFTAVLGLTGGTANWMMQGNTAAAAPLVTVSQTADEADGTDETTPDPVGSLGLSEEARTFLHSEMEAAFSTAVTEAEANGLITAEQAAILQERGMRFGHGRPGANLPEEVVALIRELHHEALATALGITPEELLAYHEAGQRLPEIAAELGLDIDEVREAVQTAWADVLAQAVADGRLTDEQAERLSQRPFGGHGRPGGHGGPHGRGGMGNGSNAPTFTPANTSNG